MAAHNRCPHCGASLDPTQPDCPECHREVPEENLVVAESDPVKRARKARWPIPWGLFVMLAVYFGAVYLYTRWEYQHAPEYKAARYLRIADQLLGSDDGRTVDRKALFDALDNLLLAEAAVPENPWTQQRLEVVARRFEERKLKVPQEQRQKLDALAARFRMAQERRTSIMPIGVHDIWDVDALASMPGRIAGRTLVGVLVIVVVWLYKVLQDRKHMATMSLQRQDERRRDLRTLARPRRRAGK